MLNLKEKLEERLSSQDVVIKELDLGEFLLIFKEDKTSFEDKLETLKLKEIPEKADEDNLIDCGSISYFFVANDCFTRIALEGAISFDSLYYKKDTEDKVRLVYEIYN